MNKRAWVLGAAMVLLTNFIAVALRAYAEGAFIDTYERSQLPWLFVANAAGFAVATLGYDALTRRAQIRVVDFALLGALGVTAVAAPSLLHAGAPPVFLVVVLTAVSQVAGLALWNRVAASVAGRDARRMLPRAGAAVTAGGMIAGLGAGGLKISGDLLPYLGAGVTMLVIGIAFAQDRALATGGAPGTTAPAGTPEGLAPIQKRLLRALIAVALLEGVVATIADFQFLAAIKGRYSDDQVTITLLLFYGATNAVLLVLQATAVPRLLVTRSLPTTASIHPTFVILGYLGFLVAPGLVAISGTRTADQVLRLATSRTAQEVSLSAFPPEPRARWKVLLRGAVWAIGATGAAVVMLVVGAAKLDPVAVASAGIAMAVAFWIAAQISARRFQAALAAPLDIQTRGKRDDPSRIDLATLERWTQVAGDADPRTAAIARAALARARVDATDLGEHLRHDDANVRAALFDQLARAPTPALVRELRTAIAIEDDDRALVLAIKALTIAGDAAGLERGRERAALSRAVADAVRAAEVTLRGGDVAGEFRVLCRRDPTWAVALVRAQPLPPDELDRVLREALDKAASAAATSSPASKSAASSAAMAAAEWDQAEGSAPNATSGASGPMSSAESSSVMAAAEWEASEGGAAKPKPRTRAPTGRSGASLAFASDNVRFSDNEERANTLAVIARIGPPGALALLGEALEGGSSDAVRAIAELDEAGTAHLAANLARFSSLARLAIARALAGAPTATTAVATLLGDADPEVAAAALRTALAVARGGAVLPAAPISAAHEAATAALVAHLDARDAAGEWSACAKHELELATRACVSRLMWASAVEVAAAGRDPATLVATARRLIGGKEPDRRRALDVIQELQAGRSAILAVLERWLRPPSPKPGSAESLAAHDPWLAKLCAGELSTLEPKLVALRKPALFASMAGPALAALADRVTARATTGPLFKLADSGETMFVVVDGALLAHRPPAPPRRIEAGGVVGELAVLTRAPRAATVTADGTANVLEIDRATFAAATRRAPDLVLGLSATLAGWIAPTRPDVL